MLKRTIILTILITLILPTVIFAGGNKDSDQTEIVVTSWRAEDSERMARVNQVYMAKNPGVKVTFSPINDTEYDANMVAAMETGTGADVVFLRSFDIGESVYDLGFIQDLNAIVPALKDFDKTALGAWSKGNGTIYGIPVAGVTHGIFYNKTIFAKYGLSEPQTWDEFITVCKTLKDNGEVPISQGGLDDWTLYEVVFSGLGANFYGGEKARQALLKGDAKLTDPNFIKAFEMVNELVPYFPKGYQGLDYVSMQQLFGTGQAAMFIGGSWELGVLLDLGADSLGWFAPPVENKGDTLQYCFHVDMGVGMSKKAAENQAVIDYMNWLASPEFAQLYMNEVPGFYSYTPGDYQLDNELAEKMVNAAQTAALTIRTVWESMSAQAPSGNGLMGEALPKMVRGEITPAEAAAYVQKGLDTWYKP